MVFISLGFGRFRDVAFAINRSDEQISDKADDEQSGLHMWTEMAAAGTNQRLNPGSAMVASRERKSMNCRSIGTMSSELAAERLVQ